jgi:thiosulfate/3-mercaptopyruvate sulfurtransferase
VVRGKTQLLATSLILVFAVSLTPLPARAQQVAGVGFLVTASWLAEVKGDPNIVVVDLRPAEAYSQGHIPGAISLPAESLALAITDEAEIGPWQTRTVELLGSLGISPGNVVISYDDNGNFAAARLYWVLKHFGHEQVAVLDGGLSAWTVLGQPLASEPTSRPATVYSGTVKPERLATWKYVLDHLGDPNVQILDVRPPAGYTGENPGALRGGHIPTALNLNWNNNVQAEAPRTFKSLAELQALYDGIGLDRSKEIIVYCTSGLLSANTLFVLDMLGYPRVRLYSASWGEWGNREDLPVVTGPEPGTPPA